MRLKIEPVHWIEFYPDFYYFVLFYSIYWIDHGCKSHRRKRNCNSSINRAFDNGTFTDKTILKTTLEDIDNQFNPYEIEIDSYNRLMFWNDESTNYINIERLDQGENKELESIGILLPDKEDKPRAIAIHPFKSLIFFVNIGNPIRIEHSRMDGKMRKTIIDTNITTPIDICVDTQDDLLFWVDLDFPHLERSTKTSQSKDIA